MIFDVSIGTGTLGLILLSCSLWILRIYLKEHPSRSAILVAACYLLFKNPFHHKIASGAVVLLGAGLAAAISTSAVAILGYFYYAFDKSQLTEFEPSIPLVNNRRGDGQEGDILAKGPLGFRVFPCQTTHTRLFPKRHSFSYSYLLVGVPLPLKPQFASSSSKDPIEWDASHRGKPMFWFSVRSEDHLERDGAGKSLRAKLDQYLRDQSEDPVKFPFAYLVTAPTFLGYCFNPVSFWYLYDGQSRLRSMILEVNNTFDERRMYLLKQSSTLESTPLESPIEKRTETFTNSWPKDFHVSPFNSRKGGYSLRAEDILPLEKEKSGQISNVITLSSSKGHAKLVASIRSTAPSIEANGLSNMQKARFILSWCWVGFMTYPRIVKEAAKLFFRRKLHVWYRPEVLPTSIGRRANASERAIEPCFRDWLRLKVEERGSACHLEYDPVTLGVEGKHRFEAKGVSVSPAEQHVLFKPTTPLFYSNLATASNLDQYLNSCLQCADPSETLLHTNQATALQNILQACPPTSSGRSPQSKHPSTRYRFTWWLIYLLRGLHLNQLDQFAIQQGSKNANQYRRGALKLLLARRCTLGLVEIVELLAFLVNAAAICTSTQIALKLIIVTMVGERADTIGWDTAGLFMPHALWLIGKVT